MTPVSSPEPFEPSTPADDPLEWSDAEPVNRAGVNGLRPSVRRVIGVCAVLVGLAAGALVVPALVPQTPTPVLAPATQTTEPTEPPDLDGGDISGGLTPFAASTVAPITEQALQRAAIQQVLDARTRAVALKQVEGFNQTVASGDASFVSQQKMLANNLVTLPFDRWRYRIVEQLDSSDVVAGPLLRRYGTEAKSFSVEVTYHLAGFGSLDSVGARVMTFVSKGASWKVVGDVDTGAFREPWDVAPLTVQTGQDVLMLISGNAIPVQAVMKQAEEAVRSVTAIWGRDWDRRVVIVVPSSQDQLGTMLRRDGAGYSNLAAVATAEARGGPGVGPSDRVWINPSGFQRITTLGRLIVLRHEITHVATRAAIPSDFDIWLEEGFADYVGYLNSGVSQKVIASELLADARAGRIPSKLPNKADFRPTNKKLSQAYEGAWWAARFIADRYGQAVLIRVYRTALARKNQSTAVDTALRSELGISTEELTKLWQESIRAAAR